MEECYSFCGLYVPISFLAHFPEEDELSYQIRVYIAENWVASKS